MSASGHTARPLALSTLIHGHEAVGCALAELGPDPSTACNDETTPVYIASPQGQEAVGCALVELGTDPCAVATNNERAPWLSCFPERR